MSAPAFLAGKPSRRAASAELPNRHVDMPPGSAGDLLWRRNI